jgi:hypothetical protein
MICTNKSECYGCYLSVKKWESLQLAFHVFKHIENVSAVARMNMNQCSLVEYVTYAREIND